METTGSGVNYHNYDCFHLSNIHLKAEEIKYIKLLNELWWRKALVYFLNCMVAPSFFSAKKLYRLMGVRKQNSN